MTSQLDQLKQFTTVVSDTGDFGSIKKYHPQDGTTNPSLILKAAQKSEYHEVIQSAVKGAKSFDDAYRALFVEFGYQILNIVKGRVSIEVDPRLSWDVEKSITFAEDIISRAKKRGIDQNRILIKLASTWEGIEAASILEKKGIHCNMTLLFSMAQAAKCAEANVTLISPFVGRIHDYWKKEKKVDGFKPEEDPGVQSVTDIYHYLKKFDYKTQVMGASFRNKGEILHLAGADLLTIAPELLEELSNCSDPVNRFLSIEEAKKAPIKKMSLSKGEFEFFHNEDRCAAFLLGDGIHRFHSDLLTLLDLIKKFMG